MLATGPLGWAAPAIDSAFLIVFAAVVWREVLAGKNLRNLPVCGMVSLLALANVAFHLRAARAGIGMIPDYMAEEQSDLVPVLTKAEIDPPSLPVLFVYPEELKTSKKVQVLRDFLVAKARQWKD